MNATKLFRVSVAAVGIGFLCGCPSVSTHPLAQPEKSEPRGPYVHSASGIVMPETVGNFKRGTILRFDAEGLDVGVSYNLNTASRHIAATVYVYPAPHVASIGSTAEVIAGARARLAE